VAAIDLSTASVNSDVAEIDSKVPSAAAIDSVGDLVAIGSDVVVMAD
jgi:hypothetical protein